MHDCRTSAASANLCLQSGAGQPHMHLVASFNRDHRHLLDTFNFNSIALEYFNLRNDILDINLQVFALGQINIHALAIDIDLDIVAAEELNRCAFAEVILSKLYRSILHVLDDPFVAALYL